ncbi:hypothetical protein [Paenibacillus turpanensis]|uniref:hypothetical protein n=1 Tax=Paenibacillus turpanensis TaxID=2689078 RepID=UPI001407756E|nr:hypothetical protein [Paenibacillus turpanensis]
MAVLAGCAGDPSAASKSPDSSEALHTSHAELTHAGGFKPTLEVNVTVEGNQATVQIETDLNIENNLGKERRKGEGHIHMYVDSGEKQSVVSKRVVLTELSKGEHSVKVSLHNNDHTPYDVTDSVAFEVK